MAHEAAYESVDWTEIESSEVAVVDGEHVSHASRYGTDENGEAWLQDPGQWTRGPMQSDRVEIVDVTEDKEQ